MKKNNITIKSAKEISAKSGYPIIIIFGYDPDSGRQHVTTYGRTIGQCKNAAASGNYLKRYLGWPENLCNAAPARVKRGAK